MSYCINPKCPQRQQPDDLSHCAACGTPLLIQERYRLLSPMRELDAWSLTDIFAVDDGGRQRVMKVLKQPKLLSLFEREVFTLQQLDHPGIPQVDADGYFTVDIANGGSQLACLVMEHIDGLTLEQWLEKHGPADSALAQTWLRQVVEILDLVHQTELFHRDIKLSNIMLRPNDQIALIDFGTVRQVTNTYLAKISGKRDVTSIVSPGYTPLEQINGKAVPQSDFYALGRSFVHLLTGEHPVDLETDDDTGALSWRQAAPQVEPWFADLIDDLTAPFPGQRPFNAQEILQRLDTKPQRPRPPSHRPWLQVLVGLNMVLLILHGFLGWRWWQEQQLQPQSEQTQPQIRALNQSHARIEGNGCKWPAKNQTHYG